MTDMNERLGEILRDGERLGIRYERAITHPPAKVWRALTESEHLRHWFPADILGERHSGAEIRLRFWPEAVERAETELAESGVDPGDPELPGKILTWEPPRIFEFLWDDEQLRFEITPDGPGSQLLCTIWFGTPGPRGQSGTAAGYHFCLDALLDALDGRPEAAPEPEVIDRLERRYAEEIGDL
ncbi:SRPBCC domain-containing protein [Nocardia sp. NPDC048505]|uniref:SRPBCC domain-containing protein n=1 Tax=unclassified Nocardia TaxID=2637762 RepID=UPI00340FFC55